MDTSDPMFWLIEGLALLVAVLALRGPWGLASWKDDADPALRESREPAPHLPLGRS